MKKKFYSSVLAMLLSMTGTTVWAQTHVSTADQLKAITATTDVVLDNDIDMSGSWSSISDYSGTFDGGGFTITNLGNNALFNTTTGTATIKNLTITGGTRAMNSDDGNGVFINQCRGNLTIQNCVNETPVTGNGYNWHAGGYVGQIDVANVTVDIIDCVNKADVTVGSPYGTYGWGDQIGGFVGYAVAESVELNFTRCQNQGNVSNTSGNQTGGFLGCSSKANSNVIFTDCTNTGTISASKNQTGGFLGNIEGSGASVVFTNCQNQGDISKTGGNHAGGLLGYANGSNATFTNCTNSGTITNTGTQTGGLMGFISGSVSVVFTNCMNTGDVSSTSWSVGGIAGQSNQASMSFENCGNTGKITCTSEGEEACPLVGNLYACSPTATNCWNIGETQGKNAPLPLISRNGGTCTNCYDKYNAPSGVTLITDEQVKSGSLAYKLNQGAGTTIFYQNLDNGQTVDAYPVMDNTHGQVYPKTKVTGCNAYICSNTESASVNEVEHDYVDGVCSLCNAPEASYMTAVDGVFQIGTAAQLRWFSAYVNAGNNSANAVVTADIDLENVPINPIGRFGDRMSGNVQYRSTFDGQGHIIKNLKINTGGNWETGLFGRLAWSSGAVVKNLGVENADITSGHDTGRASAIVGFVGADCTVENCFVFGTININAGNEKGGVVAPNSGTVKNCWTTYEKVSSGNTTNSFAAVTAEQMASGELCYNINNGAGSTVYYQNLDNGQTVDTYPVLNSTHGTVYKKASYKCDRVTPSEGTVVEYSNSVSAVTIEDHSFVADNSQPVCTVCGLINETYAITLTDGFYQLGTANDLVWYSAYINQKNNEANAAMTADIDMSSVANFTPIGLFADDTSLGGQRIQYSGTFEGNGHVIRNLTINDTKKNEAGLFSRATDLATIQNLGIENATISCTNGANRCGVLIGWMGQPIIKNVYAVGSFSLSVNGEPKASTALVAEAWAASKVSNCWTVCDAITANKGNGTNGYAGVTTNQMSSGELCYNLNQGAGETVYYETLGDGEDNYPVLDATHGKVSKMGAAGYSTFYKGTSACKFSSAVEVYTGEKKTEPTEHITLVRQDNTIPARTGVVLKAAAGSYYSVTDVASAPAITGTNNLTGSDVDVTVTAMGNVYVLANKSKGVGFYPAAEGLVIPAGKAYVVDASGVKAFVFDFDDATGIEAIEHSPLTTDESIYNLAGQKMSKMQRGVNIIGGKKVMVK